jgi:hypothetical protein
MILGGDYAASQKPAIAMNSPNRPLRVAMFAALLLFLVTIVSCSAPPDNVLKDGVAASAQIALTRMNPFAAMANVTLKDYAITNTYKRDDVQVYEYTGTVVVKGGMGNPNPNGTDVKVSGKVGFRKAGNRWEAITMM